GMRCSAPKSSTRRSARSYAPRATSGSNGGSAWISWYCSAESRLTEIAQSRFTERALPRVRSSHGARRAHGARRTHRRRGARTQNSRTPKCIAPGARARSTARPARQPTMFAAGGTRGASRRDSTAAGHLRDLGREVLALRLLDALTALEPNEAAQRDVAAHARGELLAELLDGLAGLEHALLLEQADLPLPLGELAFDDLGARGLRLAFFGELRGEDLALLGPRLGGDLARREIERRHGRDLHRGVVEELGEVRRSGDRVARRARREHDADLAAHVDVRVHLARAVDRDALPAAHGDVLAEPADE